MTRLSRGTPASDTRDRGAVLIEFVLIAPVLLLFLLGVFEYGNAWRQVGSIERATQQGARVTSSMANNRYADYEGLRAVDTATRGLAGLTVERMIIYRVTDADGAVPDACLSGSVSGLCNHYTGAQVRSGSLAGFSGGTLANPQCSASSLDAAWCPVDRPRETDALVRIGVHLTMTYEPVTGLFPADVTIERTAVYQIEPCQQGEETC